MDVWIHGHLTWVIEMSGRPPTINAANAILAAVTWVNFPGFQDVRHLILMSITQNIPSTINRRHMSSTGNSLLNS